jgi:hypothetical protein
LNEPQTERIVRNRGKSKTIHKESWRSLPPTCAGAAPFRLVGGAAPKSSEHRVQVQEEEEEEDEMAKSQTSTRRAVLKGVGASPHLQLGTHRVSETFASSRACPDETTARSRGTSVPAEYGLAEFAHSHDGAVTSVTSAEMPEPITAPMITTTAITAPTRHPQASTATITNKSSRASLQLTHELGSYIRRMRLRAPTENMKNISNTKIIQLSLSTTPRLPLRLGGY